MAADEIDGNAIGVLLDLADPVVAARLAEDIRARYGPVDILVNNAAILIADPLAHLAVEDLVRMLLVNTAAPFALIQVFGRDMQRRGWGRIVNVSSIWGSFASGLEGPLAYAISKAALNALTVKSAEALSNDVKVNAACPGWVRTRMGGQAARRSPEQGAETPVWLATLPDDGPTGGFFRDRQRIEW